MPPVTIRLITSTDIAIVATLDAWASRAAADQGLTECRNLRDCVKATGAPSHVLNYGIFVEDRFIGGIHTSGEHFNVMWIHWDERGKGIGPQAAYAVLSAQLTRYPAAIVNQPNRNMCKALVKIMTPQRAHRVSCRDGISEMRFISGDLRRPLSA